MLHSPFFSKEKECTGKILPACCGSFLPKLRALLRPLLVVALLVVMVACTMKPHPLTMKHVASTLNLDQKKLYADQEPVTRPIDLYEAMARTLKYNLEYRVEMLEKVIALTEIDLSSDDLLPKLAANAGFTSRDSVEGSSGYSISTQTPSNSYSTSQDRKKVTADLGVAWNILDFGVSYYQAKQMTDRYLISEENRRKLLHSQIQEVQSAYWRAVSAQNLQKEIDPILVNAKKALEDAQMVEQERLRPQLEIMRYQRALLDIVRQLESLHEELTQAKINLSKLLNLPPGTPFVLQEPDEQAMKITTIRVTSEEMEQLALLNRPELRMELYNARINAADTRLAILKILPGLDFKTTRHYDSNSFAMNSTWGTAGIQLTGNLMRLIAAPAELRQADNKEAVHQLRRLALNMAIISQVHIAYRQYLDTGQKFAHARQINDIDQRILKNIAIETTNDAQNRLEQIRAATQAIMSRLQHNKAFADYQNALGMIFVSLGVDLLPKISPDDSIDAMADALREAMESWKSGISSESMARNLDEKSSDPLTQFFMESIDFSISEPERKNKKEEAEEQELISNDLLKEEKNTSEEELKNKEIALKEILKAEEILKKEKEKKSAKKEEPKKGSPEKKAPILSPDELKPAVQGGAEEEIRGMIQEWADAWSRHDSQDFLRYYSDSFTPAGNWNLIQWKDSYKLLFSTTAKTVKTFLIDLAVEVASPELARAFVMLKFDSMGILSEKRKTLVLKRESKGWKIIEELPGTVFAKSSQTSQVSSQTHETDKQSSDSSTLATADQKEIWNMIHSWAEAWSAQELEKYLEFYSSRFKPPQNLSLEEWKNRRKANFNWRRNMQIKVEGIKLTQPESKQDPVRVELLQHYYYNRFHTEVKMKITLIKEEGEWKILEEKIDAK